MPNNVPNDQVVITEQVSEQADYLEERVGKLELQLKNIELKSKWDSSIPRVIFTFFSTYIFVALFLYYLDIEDYLLNALIPSGGYLVSLISVPFVRKLWVRYYIRENLHDGEHNQKANPVFPS